MCSQTALITPQFYQQKHSWHSKHNQPSFWQDGKWQSDHLGWKTLSNSTDDTYFLPSRKHNLSSIPFFLCFWLFWDVKYPFDSNPTLSEEKAARSRPCVHETLCICSVRLLGWECRHAYTWQRRRWDSLGRDVPGGAGSSACPEALCELNGKCTAHYICGCHTM